VKILIRLASALDGEVGIVNTFPSGSTPSGGHDARSREKFVGCIQETRTQLDLRLSPVAVTTQIRESGQLDGLFTMSSCAMLGVRRGRRRNGSRWPGMRTRYKICAQIGRCVQRSGSPPARQRPGSREQTLGLELERERAGNAKAAVRLPSRSKRLCCIPSTKRPADLDRRSAWQDFGRDHHGTGREGAVERVAQPGKLRDATMRWRKGESSRSDAFKTVPQRCLRSATTGFGRIVTHPSRS